MSLARLLPVALILSGCAVHHPPTGNAVFRIESREGNLHLVPPDFPGGAPAEPIPFIKILSNQYGYNPWEQYVDLATGMRLAIQRMVTPTQTDNSYVGILPSGRQRFRLQPPGQRARYLRLFYQTKFVKSPGQPVRSAICLWSESKERLQQRTGEARDNPSFTCGAARDCMAFGGNTTVSPELQVRVNDQPRYVLFGSTVRDVLRADRVTDFANLRVLRKHQGRLVPVTWKQSNDVLTLPLVADDQMSW